MQRNIYTSLAGTLDLGHMLRHDIIYLLSCTCVGLQKHQDRAMPVTGDPVTGSLVYIIDSSSVVIFVMGIGLDNSTSSEFPVSSLSASSLVSLVFESSIRLQ